MPSRPSNPARIPPFFPCPPKYSRTPFEKCRKKVEETKGDQDKHDEALKKLADQEGKRNGESIEIYESDDMLKRVIDMGLKLEGSRARA